MAALDGRNVSYEATVRYFQKKYHTKYLEMLSAAQCVECTAMIRKLQRADDLREPLDEVEVEG